jgi:hypothetical protein
LSDIQTDKKGSRHAVQLLAERDEEPLRTPGVPNLFGVYFPPPRCGLRPFSERLSEEPGSLATDKGHSLAGG